MKHDCLAFRETVYLYNNEVLDLFLLNLVYCLLLFLLLRLFRIFEMYHYPRFRSLTKFTNIQKLKTKKS